MLHVNIGAKHDQTLAESHRVDFVYEVAASKADYLQVNLGADEGPLGTRKYRISLEAAPARMEKGLRDWFASVERFPRQLHDMESADYLAMKRREYSRQREG